MKKRAKTVTKPNISFRYHINKSKYLLVISTSAIVVSSFIGVLVYAY